jgi:hypothetical protein
MWPRQPRRNAWGKIIDPGEAESEVWIRMAHSLKTHDFTALSRVYQVPQNNGKVEPVRIKSELSKPRGRPALKKRVEDNTAPIDKTFDGEIK